MALRGGQMKKNRIMICKVEPQSAAMDAGIEPGDFLLSVNAACRTLVTVRGGRRAT